MSWKQLRARLDSFIHCPRVRNLRIYAGRVLSEVDKPAFPADEISLHQSACRCVGALPAARDDLTLSANNTARHTGAGSGSCSLLLPPTPRQLCRAEPTCNTPIIHIIKSPAAYWAPPLPHLAHSRGKREAILCVEGRHLVGPHHS